MWARNCREEKHWGSWVQKAHTSDPGPIFSYLYLPENDPPVPAALSQG